jgi:hypothetical protein
MDLQSSIFYPPIDKQKLADSRPKTSENDSTYLNNCRKEEANFGRKETMKREMAELPYNSTQIKGNSSRLFGMEERVLPKSEQTIPMPPLIPNRMQWDQHDSVKYSHINCKVTDTKTDKGTIENVEESLSTVFTKEEAQDIRNEVTQPKPEVDKK